MMFRNAQIYRLPTPWVIDKCTLADALARKHLRECGALDCETRGFVVPRPDADDSHVYACGGHWHIRYGAETRILPAAVIQDETTKRADALAQQQGYKLGRKQLKELREQITTELMPRAFTRRRYTDAWVDPEGGWLVIDAPSTARAEDVLEQLRQALDRFPLTVLRTERSPMSAMADWLAGNEAPAGFTIDRDCELRSVTEDGASVRYAHHSLEGDEVKGHLEAGKLPRKLAMTYGDRVSFVLTEQGGIKRLDYLDILHEDLRAAGAEDASALADAEWALMTGELSKLISALIGAMGGELRSESVV
ncbi:recombination-associated protein RdgC [Azoarcus communis]|uniref:recombination-associated protein RdgC n=1 Tax=Parazoarcus communis TaxID=41977 RepID=UPI0014592FBD|nr:recombination-associated protein RdgC [Parazoarcus communis]NMG48961.1 recombination-associated protein RdgC [Parazoarcus communis]